MTPAYTMDQVATAVEWVESGGNPKAVSGCYRGLMQVCTKWAHCQPDELFNPEINRREGRRILAYWLRKAKGDWAFALGAYNCGWNGLKGKCGTGYARAVLRRVKTK